MSGRISRADLSGWAKNIIWILFVIIIGYLLVASIFSTCYLGGYSYLTMSQTTEINSEHTFYIRDHYIQHFIVFVIFSIVLLLVKGEKTAGIVGNRYLGTVLCAVAGIVAVLVVAKGQYLPKYDQTHVVEAAARLNQNIYSDFDVGDYLFVFPFQTGTVLYFQLLSILFGNLNYVAFQIVNCLWIALTYYLFMKIAGLLWGEENYLYQIGAALIGLLFFPYLLYSTFLYGTVVGMMFAVLSFYVVLLYEKTPRIYYLITGGLAIGIATVVKSNYVIFMIAGIVYLLIKIMAEKDSGIKKTAPRLVMIAVLVACYFLGRIGVTEYIKSMNGGAEVAGIPMTAWIAMGLQDGKAAPGWYNGYNNAVFIENEFDYERTSATVMDEIRRIVSGYPGDIQTTVSFFVKKVSSQWNNPTIQSLWVLEERPGKDGLAWLLHGTGRYLYILWVNLLQTWILTGAFLYAVLRFKKSSVEEILLPVTFVGGFVFHLFWEAEGLYAILYYPLLLPVSVCGYGEWRRLLLAKKEEIISCGVREWSGRRKGKIIVCAVAVIAVCALSYTDPFAKLFARNDNTGVFDTYTQETVDERDAWPE